MEKLLVINVPASLRIIRKKINDLDRPHPTNKPHEIDNILEALDYIIAVEDGE